MKNKKKPNFFGYILIYFAVVYSMALLTGLSIGTFKIFGIYNSAIFMVVRLCYGFLALWLAYKYLSNKYESYIVFNVLSNVYLIWVFIGVITVVLYTFFLTPQLEYSLEKSFPSVIVGLILLGTTLWLGKKQKTEIEVNDNITKKDDAVNTVEEKHCDNCGTLYKGDYIYCPNDGAKLELMNKRLFKLGARVDLDIGSGIVVGVDPEDYLNAKIFPYAIILDHDTSEKDREIFAKEYGIDLKSEWYLDNVDLDKDVPIERRWLARQLDVVDWPKDYAGGLGQTNIESFIKEQENDSAESEVDTEEFVDDVLVVDEKPTDTGSPVKSAHNNNAKELLQRKVIKNNKTGLFFSIFWLLGIGSIIAILNGLESKKIIETSDYNLEGIVMAWINIVFGLIGISFILWAVLSSFLPY